MAGSRPHATGPAAPSPAAGARLRKALDQAAELARRGEGKAAEALLQQLRRQAPDMPEIHFWLGRLAHRRRDHDAAESHLREALRLAPGDRACFEALLAVLEEAGRTDAALALVDEALRSAPRSDELGARKARLLQQAGDLQAAGRLLRRLIRAHPRKADLYRLLAQGERLKPGDPAVRQMRALVAHPRLNDAGKASLGYALAKVMADNGRHDEVFAWLHLANAHERRQYPFDFAQMAALAEGLLAAQEGLGFPPRPVAAPFNPVFIIGPPRSGTTLLERMLSRHSQLEAAGEPGLAHKGALHLLRRPDGSLRKAASLDASRIDAFRRAYERHVRALAGAGDAWGTIDKSMGNERILGLIRHAMPSARLVVLRREPRAVALSMYLNQFVPGTHRYANDLGDIARYLHLFETCVAHWKARLGNEMFEMSYEALVQDPAAELGRLLDWLGLPMETACLHPEQGRGMVRTLSFAEVRQPVHQASVRAWERHAADLRPFDETWEKLNEPQRNS